MILKNYKTGCDVFIPINSIECAAPFKHHADNSFMYSIVMFISGRHMQVYETPEQIMEKSK